MPTKPSSVCRKPSCTGVVFNNVCSVCGIKRETKPSKGCYGWWWSNSLGTGMRDRFLQCNPLCIVCLRDGRTEPATCADHIVPHRGNKRLLYDWGNLQPLCARHHSLKTIRGE